MAAFEAAHGELRDEGVRVFAASTDPEEKARETVETLGLRFPVGYGLPLHETAEQLGAFYEDRRRILHATGFLYRPGNAIGVAVYSTGAIGRLTADDVLRLVRYWKKKG